MSKGMWFTEHQTPALGITCKIKETLMVEKTPFQDLAVVDTETFGRMLILDNTVQTTIMDEFVYHEMIVHVAMNTHPNPKRVLVIGGGDGGTIREVIKHSSVEKATLVEIDQCVIDAAKKYLPEISIALDDPRVEVICDDGIKHVKESESEYDVIIVDSTDPVGPAVGLFSAEFYKAVYRALTPDGVFVAQTESPFFNKELISRIWQDVKGIYPVTKFYTASIPTYPSGLWSFTIGSKVFDPETVDHTKFEIIPTRYYNPELHKAVFVLPNFVAALLKEVK